MIKTVTIVICYTAIILLGVVFPNDIAFKTGDFFMEYLDLSIIPNPKHEGYFMADPNAIDGEEDFKLYKRIKYGTYDILIALAMLVFVARDYWMWHKTGTKSIVIVVSFWGFLIVLLNFVIIVIQSFNLWQSNEFVKWLDSSTNPIYWLFGYALFVELKKKVFDKYFDKYTFKFLKHR